MLAYPLNYWALCEEGLLFGIVVALYNKLGFLIWFHGFAFHFPYYVGFEEMMFAMLFC